jgi:hypothetical protein
MIALHRGLARFDLPPLLWEALQLLAKQAGWHPAGAFGIQDGQMHGGYRPGQLVRKSDAARLAAALEQVVNGEKGDSGDLDLAAIVALVNFLRGDAFEIR